MTYFRRGMGDGPITDPCQVDPSLCGPGTIVGTSPPTRVDCSQIPADSPFRQPGQPCAPAPAAVGPAGSNGSGVTGWLLGLINPSFSTSPAGASSSSAQGMGDDTKLLLLGGAAALAYYYFRKKRRP